MIHGGGGGGGLSAGASTDWFKMRDMKSRINSLKVKELQPNGHRIYLPNDSKWTNKSRGELSRFGSQWKITCQEPNSLAVVIRGSLTR